MFCAGGTSFDWTAGWTGVIFPASMPEVNAVTGIKDNLTTRCDACHIGSEIDFVAVMEKASTLRNPLTLPMTGDLPSTVGGSSVATASTAGMAAGLHHHGCALCPWPCREHRRPPVGGGAQW